MHPAEIDPIRPVLARVIDRWHPLQIWRSAVTLAKRGAC
jgi:hypothetical protein